MFMETFKSSVNYRRASFKSNKKAMLNLIDELNNYLNKTNSGFTVNSNTVLTTPNAKYIFLAIA